MSSKRKFEAYDSGDCIFEANLVSGKRDRATVDIEDARANASAFISNILEQNKVLKMGLNVLERKYQEKEQHLQVALRYMEQQQEVIRQLYDELQRRCMSEKTFILPCLPPDVF